MNPLRQLIKRGWNYRVAGYRPVLLLPVVLWLVLLRVLIGLCGCATTSQPVRYECPQRLIQQWQFTYCMTGPYPWMVAE